jgi:hypothetical protein
VPGWLFQQRRRHPNGSTSSLTTVDQTAELLPAHEKALILHASPARLVQGLKQPPSIGMDSQQPFSIPHSVAQLKLPTPLQSCGSPGEGLVLHGANDGKHGSQCWCQASHVCILEKRQKPWYVSLPRFCCFAGWLSWVSVNSGRDGVLGEWLGVGASRPSMHRHSSREHWPG